MIFSKLNMVKDQPALALSTLNIKRFILNAIWQVFYPLKTPVYLSMSLFLWDF